MSDRLEDMFPDHEPDRGEDEQQELDASGRKKYVDLSVMDIDRLGLKSKSDIIRHLLAEGYAPTGIARFLGVRYQHVRNVSQYTLKRKKS